jgi:protein tyrosine/serine phosphatase
VAIPRALQWTFGLLIATFVIAVPILHYRAVYNHERRLRTVQAGVLYRSGCLTVEGFADTVARYHIKTIINFQDEFPDPAVRNSYLDTSTTSEVELCRRLGVRYVFIAPDLISRQRVTVDRPQAIDQFLAIMDDPANYPVLIHCKAGLHRTGVMAAVYRMEYQGWTPEAALYELRAHGFGEFAGTAANDYIVQYILAYKPGRRAAGSAGGL